MLKTNITIEKEILDKIEQQLRNINLFQEKIKKAKKYAIFS